MSPATEPGSPGSPEETAPRRGPLERQLNVGLMVVLVSAALLVFYGVAFIVSAWDGHGRRSRSAITTRSATRPSSTRWA